MCKLKHLAVAAAIVGLATQVQAGYFPGSTDFEDNPLTNAVIWSGIDNVAEAIVPDATVPSPRPATYTPSSFSTTRANVLSVDNDVTSPIICNINGGAAMPASTIYADALVKGAPLANDASVPDLGQTDKLLVYTRVNAAGTDTNLCVLAKPDANSITNEYVLTSTHIGKDEWHRVIIEAVNDGTYKVYCDTFDQNAALGTYYPITAGSSMSSVAFAGTGSVDDLILSDLIPEQPVYSITWDTSLASVKYTTGGITTNDLTVADGRYEFQDSTPSPITLIGDTGYRTFERQYTPSTDALTFNLDAPTGIAKYFPQTATASQDGTAGHPFEIADVDDLLALAAAANDGVLAGGALHFVQIADIDFTGAEAFAGIGAQGAENATTLTLPAFEGVYDGGNHTIANVTFTNRKGSGIFNLVRNATLKDLTVDTVSYEATFDAQKLGGAMIVGNGVNCTLQHLVTLGSNGLNNPCTYNAAGIVNRLEGRGGPVLVIGCTNNATIYGCYSKIGGICPIVQGDSTTVTFIDCANAGDIVANGTAEQLAISQKTPGVDGAGGILGYAQGGSNYLSFTNCVNTGTITGVSGTKIGSIFAYCGSSPGVKATGCSAQATIPSIHTGASKVSYLNFATVDNGVATFVPDTPLAAGNTYKVMASGATATYSFTAPGTIAFDTAMCTPTYAITAVHALTLTDSTSGTVKTYTATAKPATWVGGTQGDWDTASNWDGGFVPTKDTVVTITNDAQVAIGSSRCKELVLTNANVTLVRASGVAQPILHFYSNEGRAVSVASGATGSLAVNGISLFNQRTDSADLTIGCGLEILGDLTFRGVNPGNNVSASFTITNKTTISADAIVKTIDYGTTKFLGGIEVAKGVTAKITTKPHGTAQIGTGVTLVANDGEGAATAIWLMQNEGTSRGVSLVNNASIAVDADHAGLCYVTQRSEREDYIPCDIYEVYWKRTVTVTTNGVTVAGVENGQKVVPGTNLVISVTGFVEGYEPSVTITKTADSSVLLTTNAVSFTYTMPDFDIDVSATAVKTVQSFNDPEGRLIEDYAVISWLSNNGFTQAQIDALGNNAAGTDRLYYCYLLNLNFTVQDASAALSFTEITVSNRVSMTVQLVRKAPLAGYINGALYIYGANDLAAGFGRSPIPDESVEYFTGDPSFNLVTGSNDTVTQTAVATMNTSVTAKFFKATIEVPWVDNGDEPYWEPEPDPDPDPEE